MLKKVILSDPGFVNLKTALRGTVSVVISFFAISFIVGKLSQPSTLAFVGVIVAMMSSISVNDSSRSQQKITLLYISISSALAFAVSVGTGPLPAVRIGGFLAISFLAVFLRRYGPRGVAVGTVAFMAYFCPLFFPVRESALLAGAVAIFVAVLVTFVVRFYIFLDRPEKDLKYFLEAFEMLITETLSILAEELAIFAETRGLQKEARMLRSRDRIQKHLVRLNELGLTLETVLITSDSLKVKSRTEVLQMYLFERELGLRQFLDFISTWVEANSLSKDLASEAAAAEKFRAASRAIAGWAAAPSSFYSMGSHAGPEFDRALSALAHSVNAKSKAPQSVATVVQEITAVGMAPVKSKQTWYTHISTRQAVQATLATGLASAIGVSISVDRWYWASLTAFVVFAGATRGETLQRAFLRVLGTFAGLIVGFLMAYMLSGHHALEWSVIIACVFVGMYGAKYTYGFWTASSFTLLLAVLYDVLGQLTTKILFLRLEETIAGSLVGGFVAALIMPTSTRSTVKIAMATYLRSVALTLDELSRQVDSPFERRNLVRRLREVDRNLMALRASSSPIMGRFSILKKGDVPATVYDASVVSHLLRHIASYTEPREVLSDEQVTALCVRLSAKARSLAAKLEEPVTVLVDSLNADRSPEDTDISFLQTKEDTPSRWFSRIDQILGTLDQGSLFKG